MLVRILVDWTFTVDDIGCLSLTFRSPLSWQLQRCRVSNSYLTVGFRFVDRIFADYAGWRLLWLSFDALIKYPTNVAVVFVKHFLSSLFRNPTLPQLLQCGGCDEAQLEGEDVSESVGVCQRDLIPVGQCEHVDQ